MAATYMNMSLSISKETKLLHLDFSMKITAKHDDYLPDKVSEARKWVTRTENKLAGVDKVPPQTIDLYLDPHEKGTTLHLVGAAIETANVSIVEETGKGSSNKVVRFKFRVRVERDADTLTFANWNDGQEFWITMKQTQERLIK